MTNMKRAIFFHALLLAVPLIGLAIPAVVGAQVYCPTGYVCTPINTATTNNTSFSNGYFYGNGYTPTSAGYTPASTCSASYLFSSNLFLGSAGADVVALQNFLMAKGFDIPYVSSGAVPRGYYGFQ